MGKKCATKEKNSPTACVRYWSWRQQFLRGPGCRNGYSSAMVHGIVLQKAARQISAMLKPEM